MSNPGRGKALFRQTLICLGVFALFGAVTVFWTAPFCLGIADHAHDGVDSFLNIWALAWDHHILLRSPLELFQANIFFPNHDTLAFSEHLFSGALISYPLRLFTANPVLIHNLLLLATYPLCGLGVFLLTRRLTGSAWAGLAAGFFFAFAPYRVTQMGHVQTMSIHWLPFCLLFMHRFMQSRRAGDWAGLTVFFILHCLACNYHAVFGVLTLGLALAAFGVLSGAWQRRGFWLGMGLFGLACLAVLTPFFLPYLQVQHELGFTRSLGEVSLYSADLFDYLRSPSPSLLLGGAVDNYYKAKWILFPGLAALGLAVWGLIAKGGDRRTPAAYLGLALLCLAFSLGPVVRAAGRELFAGPYVLLFDYFPGFSGLRAPARLGLYFLFFWSVGLGFGVSALLRLCKGRYLAALAGLAVVAALALELYTWPVAPGVKAPDLARPDPVNAWLAAEKRGGAVMHLPLGDEHQDARYVLTSVANWRPMVNGYSGFFPPGYQALRELLHQSPSRLLAGQLGRMGVRWVVLHLESMQTPQKAQAVQEAWLSLQGLVRQGPLLGQAQVLELVSASGAAPELDSQSGPVRKAAAWPNAGQAVNMLGGHKAARWSSGRAQRGGEWIALELDRPRKVGGVDLFLGGHFMDMPRGLTISLRQPDGVWSPARPASGGLYPLQAFMLRPQRTALRYRVMLDRPERISGLRLEQTGSDPTYYWSVQRVGIIPAP